MRRQKPLKNKPEEDRANCVPLP